MHCLPKLFTHVRPKLERSLPWPIHSETQTLRLYLVRAYPSPIVIKLGMMLQGQRNKRQLHVVEHAHLHDACLEQFALDVRSIRQ